MIQINKIDINRLNRKNPPVKIPIYGGDHIRRGPRVGDERR